MNEYMYVYIHSIRSFPLKTQANIPSNSFQHPYPPNFKFFLSLSLSKGGKKSKQMKNKTKKIFAFGIYWEREKSFSPMLSVCTSATL